MRSLLVLSLLMPTLATAQGAADGTAAWVGTVREVVGGPSSRAELAAEDGQTYVLRGRSADDDVELRRLAGVKVRVHGLLEPSSRVAVDRFDILDIGGGVVPRLGTLAALAGEARLLFVADDGQATFLPAGFTAKLKDQVGARVWLVGTQRGEKLQVSRFAVLRPGRAPASASPTRPAPIPPKTP